MTILKRISLVNKANFTRNLAVMLGAGLSLNQALLISAKQNNNPYWQKVILKVKDNIQAGQTLADSLSLFPKIFSTFYINMIKVGETSGTLEKILKELSRQMHKSHSLRSKVKSALIYPAIILLVMIILGFIMILVIVPRMSQIFEQFDTQLPLTTRIIINSSGFVSDWSRLILLIIILLIIILFIFIKKIIKSKLFNTLKVKIPIWGKINRQFNSALMARNLSTLLKSGVPIVSSLTTTANTLPNILYKNSIILAAKEVRQGANLQSLIKNYPNLYNPLVAQIIEVGETSGQLAELLEQLADFYEEELDQIIKNISSIIEPVLIIIIGAAVGLFALSMLQPMYSLLQSV